MSNDHALEIVLRILNQSGKPLNFESIHKRSKLSAPSATRQLKRGERLGLVEERIRKLSRWEEPKSQWKITKKGKQFQGLYVQG
jgi:DNA-binding HxlR family transcriptional regulator